MTHPGQKTVKPSVRRRRRSHHEIVVVKTDRYSGSIVFATRSSAPSTTGTRSPADSATAGPISPSELTQQRAFALLVAGSSTARQERSRQKKRWSRERL